jgi:hypothetical protein
MSEPIRLRGYTVERLLGSGATGDVWQARVIASGERVAIKRLPVADAEQLRRAEAEAALLCALDHPNLVRLHAVVPEGDALLLVLDLADGGSLADVLHARGRLTPGEVVGALAPVAAAVGYLHDQGVVHGDVSAGNVLFTGSGVPLLADVGVARLAGDDAAAEATPCYLDPVVAAGGVPAPASDVFALAAVGFHALTGAPLWPGESAEDVLAAAVAGEPAAAEWLADAGVPVSVAGPVVRALHADPQRRGSAADLALDLGASVPATAVELAAGRARPEPRLPQRHGPRHAAQPVRSGERARRRRDGAGLPDAAGRPAFTRPQDAPGTPGGPAPTRMVRPRPRPVLPRPRPRRRSGRAVALGIAATCAALATTGGTLWATAARQPQPSKTAAPAQVETPSPSTGWAATLTGLDVQRAAAYAARDPARLRRVYADGPLLAADIAQLTRLVPAGCVLTGVRTRYERVSATGRAGRVTVTATATLHPSKLVCAGHDRGVAPGAGPARLALDLVRTADGYRIAGQRALAG